MTNDASEPLDPDTPVDEKALEHAKSPPKRPPAAARKSSAVKTAKHAPDTPPAAQKAQSGAAAVAARNGLPPINANRQKFADFTAYWRAIPGDKRQHVTVYVYRLFPVIILPDDEHAIALLPGENPYGGESDSAEEAILHQHGLGDYFFILKYDADGSTKEVIRTTLRGYSENLPGYRDFKNHPPLIEGELSKVVNLTDARNISSGYITYLQGKNAIPGESQKERDDDMADQTAGAVAMNTVGKFAERALDKLMEAPAPTAPPPPPENKGETFLLETVRGAIETINDVHKQHAQDTPALIRTVAELVQKGTPQPQDTSNLTNRIDVLVDKILDMKDATAADVRDQMREMRSDMRAIVTQFAQARTAEAGAQPQAVLDPMAEMGRRWVEKRMERLFGDDEEDDAPRRHRYEPEPLPAPPPATSWWQTAVENAPFIMSALGALVNGVATAAHNIQVARTGEGQSIAPGATPTPPGMHAGPPMPHMPGRGAGTGGPPPGMLMNPAAFPQQPQPPQQEDPMDIKRQMALQFLNTIEAGLVGSMERGETGFEYAELFIKTTGRLGTFGYTTLRNSYKEPSLNKQNLPFPGGSVMALAEVLSMHAGIWGKIGTSPQLELFLTQFVAYDEMLADFGARSIIDVCVLNECSSLQEVLELPDESADGAVNDASAAATPDPTPAPQRAARPKRGAAVTPGAPVPDAPPTGKPA